MSSISMRLMLGLLLSQALLIASPDDQLSCINQINSTEFYYGVAEMQGRRPSMEDAHVMQVPLTQDENDAFFAIYDGHAGRLTADVAAKHLHRLFEPSFTAEALEDETCESMVQAFGGIDALMETAVWDRSGSTALCAYIQPGHNGKRKLLFSWAGDARGLLVNSQGTIKCETIDHKPDTPSEKERIEACGGKVEHYRVARINGLAVSRALGDLGLKEDTPGAIIATPDQKVAEVQKGDILILACDGVWDVVSNQRAVTIVQEALGFFKSNPSFCQSKNEMCKKAAEVLRDAAYKVRSTDNITAMVVVINE